MDTSNPTFQEFSAYWKLSEELIADATKEDLAEVARILAMQAAHYARKYGEDRFQTSRTCSRQLPLMMTA